ncbi:aldehyde ferredoxin oxidoreductase C-terminal domain-containing protein, partial [Natrinema soli]
AFGRGGLGAVLGAKNVKAVTFEEGEFEPTIADEDGLRDLVFGRTQPLMEETETLQQYGTSAAVNPVNEMGKLDHRNNQYEQVDDEKAEAISGERLEAEYVTEDTTCANCAVRCGKHVSVQSEGITDAKIPEFETIFAVSTMQDAHDPEAMIEANDVCDRLGMDTISLGVTVAFARECHERGLLDDEVDATAALEFGDGVVDLAERIARREGIGDRLVEGSFRFAASLAAKEAENYLHGVKGLEFAAHSPRALKGMS